MVQGFSIFQQNKSHLSFAVGFVFHCLFVAGGNVLISQMLLL